MIIIEKLAKVQQNLIAPKSQFNPFGKYNYRSCEDILEGLKPCLAEVKAAVTVTDEVVQIGDRYYVKATATFHDCETEARISNVAYAREEEQVKGMSASQITGSASSYARKYALNGLFCIDDVKDADTRDNRQKEAAEVAKAEAEQKMIEKQLIPEIKVNALVSRCENDGVPAERICKLYKVRRFSELTEKQYYNLNAHWEEIKVMP